jgi:hypothetical protein
MVNRATDLKAKSSVEDTRLTTAPLHPSWAAFVRFCRELGHGEIEKLRIQDGLPMSAEIVREKIRFPP